MIWQMIEDWFRGILTDGILSNLSGLFDSVNTEVGEIATQVGTTPAGWNAGIFNMIRSLSENVIAVSYTHLDVYKRQAEILDHDAVKRTLADCLFQLFELRTIE